MKNGKCLVLIETIISLIFFLAGCSKNTTEATTTTNNSEITTTTNTTAVVKKDYSINVNKVSKDISSREIIEKNNKEYIKNGSSYTMNLSIVVEKAGNKKDFSEEFTLSIIDKDSKSLDMQIESANSSIVNSTINEEYAYTKSDITYSIPSDMDSFEMVVELLLRCNRDIEIEGNLIEIILASECINVDIPDEYTEVILRKSKHLENYIYPLYDTDLSGYVVDFRNKNGTITIPETLFGCPVVDILIDSNNTIVEDGLSLFDNVYYAGNLYNPYMVLVKLKDNDISNCVIAKGTKYIYEKAFSGCSNLESVIIPESVTSIGEYAFSDCKSLESISIPNNVTSIYRSAFAFCSSLSSISIPEKITSIDSCTFTYCTSLESISFPTNLKNIGQCAFNCCSNLTSLTIPDSVTSIGAGAFSGCSIKKATIPAFAATYIKNASLEEVTITSGKSISDEAFSDCSKLSKIHIPESITDIGSKAFLNCSSLTEIGIPEYIEKIGYSAFNNYVNLSQIDLPKNLTYIESGTFSNCSSLSKIVLPDNLKKIGYSAFKNCTGLLDIDLPKNLKSIESYAFENCSGLSIINIPDSITSIGFAAFLDCSGLETITLPHIGQNLTENTFFGYIFGDSSNNDISKCVPISLKKVIITGECSFIPQNAFSNCTSITEIVLPDNLRCIGEGAFSECGSLQEIIYAGSIDEWNAIEKYSKWNLNTGSYVIHCSDGDIAKS